MEELGLQVHNEVLGLSIVPYISVMVGDGLISADWMELDHLTEDEESDSGDNPVEEVHDLDEQPCANIIHFIIPGSEVHLNDVDHVTEHKHGGSDEQGLQSLTPDKPLPSLELNDEQNHKETDNVVNSSHIEYIQLILFNILFRQFCDIVGILHGLHVYPAVLKH